MLYIINIRREKDNDTRFPPHFDDLIIRMSIDVTLSFMSFFESPDNEDGPIVEDIENGK